MLHQAVNANINKDIIQLEEDLLNVKHPPI